MQFITEVNRTNCAEVLAEWKAMPVSSRMFVVKSKDAVFLREQITELMLDTDEKTLISAGFILTESQSVVFIDIKNSRPEDKRFLRDDVKNLIVAEETPELIMALEMTLTEVTGRKTHG